MLAVAHFTRAQLYQWQKKTPEADADYKEAFKLDPTSSMFHLARARGLMNLGQWDKAIDSLRNYLKINQGRRLQGGCCVMQACDRSSGWQGLRGEAARL